MTQSKHDLIDAEEAMEIAGEDSYEQFISGVGTIYPLNASSRAIRRRNFSTGKFSYRYKLLWSRGEMLAAMQQLALRKMGDALRSASSKPP